MTNNKTYNNIGLSSYGRLSSEPSPVNRMMAAFSADFRPGTDINLGVGYVNEETIPRRLIARAMREVLADPAHYPGALNYGAPQGSANLIASLRRLMIEEHIGGLTGEVLGDRRIVIGSNGATSILDGIARVLPPGRVVTVDPLYYIYCNYLERAGFEIDAIPEDGDGMSTDLLEQLLTGPAESVRDISFIYVVTVNNPTATILSNNRRREIVEIVTNCSRRQGRAIPIIFDTAYEHLVHNPKTPQPQSGLLFDTDGIVYEIGTLSKIIAPALRIGYIIGVDSPFLRAIVQNNSDDGFSAPLINQEMTSWLIDNAFTRQHRSVNRGYHRKARIVGEAISRELGPYLVSTTGGQASFYFYLTFRDINTAEGSPYFCYLSRSTGNARIDGVPGNPRPRVLYIPGEYCVHSRGSLVESGQRQLRLSYGFEDTARIVEALGHMREAAEWVSKRQ